MSLNKCLFIGRLGRDPEIRHLQDGTPVATFSLAVSERWTKNGEKYENTTWVNIVAWNKLADLCGQYLTKGRQVFIEGKLSIRSWEDRDGNKRSSTEIVAANIVWLGGQKQESGAKEQETRIPDEDIPF